MLRWRGLPRPGPRKRPPGLARDRVATTCAADCVGDGRYGNAARIAMIRKKPRGDYWPHHKCR